MPGRGPNAPAISPGFRDGEAEAPARRRLVTTVYIGVGIVAMAVVSHRERRLDAEESWI